MAKILLLFCICLFHYAMSAPSLVVSSTELPKENGKEKAAAPPSLPKIYEMDITANISNRFAKTLVVSKVKNPDQVANEATFTVVLPEKAFISEFVMEIGGKRYKAYVKEKEEAKEIYNQAVATGQSAAHVAVSARDSNKFTVSINMEPEGKAIFYLTYEELLERKYDKYELVLNIHPGQLVDNLKVQVNINESRSLKFVKTPSLRSGNEISKNEDKLDPSADIQIINSTSAIVKFTPDNQKQKQFAKDLGTKESDGLSGQFIVQYDVERDSEGGEILLEDGYFVHFFAPQDLEPLPKHVVFVLDTSGSMGGNKIDQLKDAMISILAQLREKDIFSIVEFNSNPHVWNVHSGNETVIYHDYEERNIENSFGKLSEMNLPLPTVANKLNIEKAQNVIKKFSDGGGTNMMDALEVGLHLVKRQQENGTEKVTKFQPIVVALTDGYPDQQPEQITKLITKLNLENNKAPLFTLSFGLGADKAFLRKIALKNFGFSRHIYEAADASLQLQDFYRQISSPLLNNIEFKYSSEAEKVTKTNFPIYFAGSELVIAGKYHGNSHHGIVSCFGFGSRGPIELKPTVEKPVTPLERLWAYLTVKQTLDARDSSDNKTELTKKALDLALKYSFVTDVSSLVVVKPNSTSAVNTEDATKVSGKNPLYAAASSGSAFPTSFGSFSISGKNPLYAAASSGSAFPTSFRSFSSSIYRSPGLRTVSGSHYLPQEPLPEPVVLPESESQGFAVPQIDNRVRLTLALPWMSTVLSANGSLTLPQGVYELGENAVITTHLECPNTPLNNTETGHCTLLSECFEVLPSLTDVQVYQQYFCPIENKYAGICCPKKTTHLR